MRFIFILCSFCLTLGCNSLRSSKKEASQAPETYKAELVNAKSLSKKNPNAAIEKLNFLLANNPENSLSDDALFLMGTLLEKSGKYEPALKSYSRILNSKYSSPLDGKAIIRKATILNKTEQYSKALSTLNYIEDYTLVDKSSSENIEKLRGPLLLKNSEYIKYLHSINNVLRSTKDKGLAQKLFSQSQDVLKIKLSGFNNKRVLNDEELSIFHPQAALNLASYYYESEKPENAIATLEEHSEILQKPTYKVKYDELIMRGQIFTTPNVDVIGIILPLTGKYQSVGHQILKGLQYSFNLWNPSNKIKFKLSILDSEGDPNRVLLAFDELIKNDKPIAIIGGLVSKTAEALLTKSKDYKVPTLVLSQKEGLTDRNYYGFQNYQSLNNYADLIAAIAFRKMNVKKIAILKSNKSFSSSYASAFEKSFSELGGEISKVVEYDLSEKRALPNSVKDLIGLLTIGERQEEYNVALRKWNRSSRGRGQSASPKLEQVLKPVVDFDGIFIADGAKNGGLIASTLAYFDVEGVPLFGTHLWNDNALLERGQRFVENAIFANSYFEPNVLESSCGKDFLQKFQEPINSYIYKGIEAGIILSNLYQGYEIKSRSSLLSALKKTDTVTHMCLPKGLVREDHNFTGRLVPLIVKDKSITILNMQNLPTSLNESPGF